jgi:sulfate/thiosulfate transport system ATP-binding protein
MSIRIAQVHRRFGSFAALDDVSLDVHDGELLALLGPSGSGKTTLLRVIAGLEAVDRGQVLFHDTDITGSHVRDRGVGFVFQHYALFRHMTIFENVAFGLRVRPRRTRPPEAEIRRKVHELLALVQLDWLADRYPHQLSGGQRQRIALARALAVEPRVLLLDEPFGALDAKVRLRRLHDEMQITSVFVTHDQDEALEVADRVVVMNEGRIQQVGTPQEVYDHPANAFVTQFLGQVNRFHGRVEDGHARIAGLAWPAADAPEQSGVHAFVRPHEMELFRPGADDGDAPTARVEQVLAVGGTVRVLLRADSDGGRVHAELSRERFGALSLVSGDRVVLRPRQMRVFAQAA